MGWLYGFKLHIIINEHGDFRAFKITPGNIDYRRPVPDMVAKNLPGKLFGDKGYISQKLFDSLIKQGVQLITEIKKAIWNNK